jgi:uncharacterized repeat protein (TIGR01451 family)/gliding motility-associated-like protein
MKKPIDSSIQHYFQSIHIKFKIMKLKNTFTTSIIFLIMITGSIEMTGQTTGLIYENSGITVLDPNNDGYISQTDNGFTVNDEAESEIAYVPITLLETEPDSDPLVGPDCSFIDFVGPGSSSPVLVYYDGTNVLFRFRLSGTSSQPNAYSILVDSDQKFGFRGSEADPNAVVGNPGFEFEIVLITGSGVALYNANGLSTPIVVSAAGVRPYADYAQKSIAYTTTCSNPDYFYDFYVPIAQLTSNFSVDASTLLRIVGANVMEPDSYLGSTYQADLSGSDLTNFEEIFACIPPVSISNFATADLSCRTSCPAIDPVSEGDLSVSGTSVEADLTVIEVFKNGLSIGTTTVSGGLWNLNPIAALAVGDEIKATAKDGARYVSFDDCNILVVGSTCTDAPTSLAVTANGKEIEGDAVYPLGTVIRLYTINGALYTDPDVTNPVTTTVDNEGWTIGHQVSFLPDSNYYVTAQAPDQCESEASFICTGFVITSGAPAITTAPVLTTTTTLNGTGGVSGADIYIYNGNDVIGNTSVSAAAWFASISGILACDSIFALQVEPGKCYAISDTSHVKTASHAPVITGNYCIPAATTVSTVTGTSVEAFGSTIEVFDDALSAGSTTVLADGTWQLTGLSIAIGSVITAQVIDGPGCLNVSTLSSGVTVGQKTGTTNLAITSTPTEGLGKTVNGTGSGEAGVTTLKLYLDGYLIGQDFAIGNWSISDLTLYAGGTLTATLTTVGYCESNPSAGVIVQCVQPAVNKTINAVNTQYCLNEEGQIIVVNPDPLTVYTPVLNSDHTVFGYSEVSNATGSNLTLTTFPLTVNPTVLTVKATKLTGGTCSVFNTNTVSLQVNPLPDQNLTVTADETDICPGDAVNITISTAENQVSYQLKNAGDDSNIGAPSVGNGSNLIISTGALTDDVTIKVTATDVETGLTTFCSMDLVNTVSITVGGSDSDQSVTVDDAVMCQGHSTTIRVLTHNDGHVYQVRRASDDAAVGASFTGDGTEYMVSTGILTSNETFYVEVFDNGICYTRVTDEELVTVNECLTDIYIQKTVDDATPDVNQTVTFTVTVTNNGPLAANDLVITDVLPSGLTIGTVTPSTGTWSAPDWSIGTLSVSGTATLTIVATVNSGTSLSIITNTVSNTQYETDNNATPDDNNENLYITGTADLSVTTHGSESTPTDIVYTVTLSSVNNTGAPITFDFDDLVTGTSSSGFDYTAIGGSAVISIPDGSTTGSFTVNVTDDTLLESTETLNVGISNPSFPGISINTSTASADITDDETASASLSVTTHGNETGPSDIVYTVTLSQENHTGSVITFAFDDLMTGTATSGDDYTAIDGAAQISVADGASTGTISVSVINDALFESVETITAQISSPSHPPVSIVTGTATANISDNETSNAVLSVTTHGDETGPISIVYTVTLDKVNHTDAPITFEFDDSGTGTATSGSDYTAVGGAAQVSVAVGASTGTFTVTVTDDASFELTETLICNINTPSNANVTITTGTATANITDNDAPNAGLSVTQQGNESGPVQIIYTVTLDHANGTGSPITFEFDDLGSGTAVSGSDYNAVGGTAQISIADGASTGTYTITVTDDALFELTETVIFNINTPSNGNVTITAADATANIADNDAPNAVLSVTQQGNEAGPVSIVYTVTLNHENNTGSAITFEFDDLTTGTATSGDDYTAIDGAAQISIADGASTGTYTVIVINDDFLESTETLNAQISNPSNALVTITGASAAANISDNETSNAVLSVTTHGDETGPISIVYTVTLDKVNHTNAPITFEFDDSGTGTATSVSDYTAVGGAAQVSVAVGSSSGTYTVTVINDALFELTETVICNINTPSNANVSITTGNTTANITDNDAPNAVLSVTQQGNESGPVNIIYTVTLNHENHSGSAITFEFDDLTTGTATSSDDYTAINGAAQISVADGASSGTYTVNVMNDDLLESMETLNAQISNPSNTLVTITGAAATANISDNETSNAVLSVTTHGDETGPISIVYTVTLDKVNHTDAPITFEFDDSGTGTATSGSDYTAVGGAAQVSVAVGASTGTFTVTVTDDASFELTETLICNINTPSNANVTITTGTATANITDNDAPNAGLSVTQQGNESGPVQIIYTVTLDHANGTGSPITFEFDDLGSGTAVSGSDYNAVGGTAQISIADGASTGTYTITVTDDALFELTETVIFNINTPSNGNVTITAADATANIADNDAPNAVLSVTQQGNEAGPVSIVYTVTLNHENNTGSAITFEFDDLTTGTATSGDDYTAIDGAAQISIADGASTGTYTVIVINDDFLESTETLNAQISNPSNALVTITGASATANISDNETSNAVLSVTTHGDETGPISIVYTVTLDKVNHTNAPITFEFDNSGTGTAVSGSDYTAVGGAAQVSVAVGSSSGTYSVTVINDALFELTETVICNINTPSNANVSITTGDATANITDNDAPNAVLSVTQQGNESGPVHIIYTVTIDHANGTGVPITFEFDDSGTGTATSGLDYTAVSGSAQVSVANGASSGTVTITITNDDLFELTETVICNIHTPSNTNVNITTANETANIADNDAPNAVLSVTTQGDEEGPVALVYTITLNHENSTGSAITFEFDDIGTGTAIAGDDYAPIDVSAQINIPNGSSTGSITVDVIDDALFEGTETLTAQISNPNNALVLITGASATGTIIDNDGVNVYLSVSTQGNESGPVDIVYTATLSLANNTGIPLTFDFDDLLTGTALSGIDYTTVDAGALISVADGDSQGSITIPVLDDTFLENIETIIAQISNPSHGDISIVTSTATATIADNENAIADLSVFVNGNESGPVDLVYTVTLSTVNHTGSGISFDFDDLFTGSALSNSDYSAIDDAATITILDGNDSGSITVTVIDDGLLESIETLRTGISNSSFPAVSINTASATGTITDNETATADLSVTSNGDETGPANMVYTVTLNLINHTGSDITFDFDDLVTGSAIGGSDYTSVGTNDLISIPVGSASGNYSIIVIDDNELESMETVNAQITNPSIAAVSILTADAGASITDNEIANADLSVTINGNESGPVDLVYTVTLSHENHTGAPISFDFDDVLTGTATVGVDYIAVDAGAQIIINDGFGTGSISVLVLDDVFYEATETVTAQISNSSFGAVNITTPIISGDIIDDDHADIYLTKTVDNDNPGEGDQITFTITVTNNGPSPLTSLVVTDIIPSGLTFVDATPSTGTWTAPDWTIGSLPVGNTETLLISVSVDAGTGGTDITNTVSNTQDQLDDNITVDDSEEMIHVDDLPVANGDAFAVNEDETLEGDVLLNDTGLNDGGIQVTVNGDVVNGTLTLNTDGSFIYIPDANYHGTDSFDYLVCDGDFDCDQATVTITVISVDDFPLAQDDEISVGEDSEMFSLHVLEDNGSGPDDFGGDNPSVGTINLIGTTSNGTLEFNDSDTPADPTDDYFIYTPNKNFFGSDEFEYEICDSDGDCDQAIVYINVVNDEVLFFPEAITPNNDGYNDFFVIEGLELFPDNLLIILNRWGNKVYEANPYNNDWNGTNSLGLSPGGEELQEGTYFFILKTNNDQDDIKGYIYIKR